jgi:hypothetical protein
MSGSGSCEFRLLLKKNATADFHSIEPRRISVVANVTTVNADDAMRSTDQSH